MNEKVAIVTGSNKGLGYEIVKGLCKKFNGIVYLTARDENRGLTAVKELEKLGFHPKFHQLDITDQKSVETFRDFIQANHKGIDILVNNAGIAFKVNSTEPAAIQATETLKVNYFGTLRISNALFPLLKPHARVVNLSSTCGHLSRIPSAEKRSQLSNPAITEEQLSELMNDYIRSAKEGSSEEDGWGTSSYNVSKNGVSCLTFIQQKTLNNDSRVDIAVNAVYPGYCNTDMTSYKGEWTPEQGAEAPLYLALLPPNEEKIKGCYVWKDKTVTDWASAASPARF